MRLSNRHIAVALMSLALACVEVTPLTPDTPPGPEPEDTVKVVIPTEP